MLAPAPVGAVCRMGGRSALGGAGGRLGGVAAAADDVELDGLGDERGGGREGGQEGGHEATREAAPDDGGLRGARGEVLGEAFPMNGATPTPRSRTKGQERPGSEAAGDRRWPCDQSDDGVRRRPSTGAGSRG